MNKIVFLTTSFFIVSLLCACTMISSSTGKIVKQERLIKGHFSKLKIAGSINVILTMGEQETVVVEANDNIMSYIEVKQVAEELFLNMAKRPRNWDTSNITIHVTAKNLEDIEVEDASTLNRFQCVDVKGIRFKFI